MSGYDLSAVRDSVRNTIRTAMPAPALLTCETHPGRFDIEELKRFAAKAPAALISVIDISDVDQDSSYAKGSVQFAVFVVTKNSPAAQRDVLALRIVSVLLRLIANNTWGLEDEPASEIAAPERLHAQNLYSAKLDTSGVNLWGITWHQTMSLDGVDLNNLDDFITYTATHVVGGDDTPVAEDLLTLEQDEPEEDEEEEQP